MLATFHARSEKSPTQTKSAQLPKSTRRSHKCPVMHMRRALKQLGPKVVGSSNKNSSAAVLATTSKTCIAASSLCTVSPIHRSFSVHTSRQLAMFKPSPTLFDAQSSSSQTAASSGQQQEKVRLDTFSNFRIFFVTSLCVIVVE